MRGRWGDVAAREYMRWCGEGRIRSVGKGEVEGCCRMVLRIRMKVLQKV